MASASVVIRGVVFHFTQEWRWWSLWWYNRDGERVFVIIALGEKRKCKRALEGIISLHCMLLLITASGRWWIENTCRSFSTTPKQPSGSGSGVGMSSSSPNTISTISVLKISSWLSASINCRWRWRDKQITLGSATSSHCTGYATIVYCSLRWREERFSLTTREFPEDDREDDHEVIELSGKSCGFIDEKRKENK